MVSAGMTCHFCVRLPV